MSQPLSVKELLRRKGLAVCAGVLGGAVSFSTFVRLRGFSDPPGQNGYFYLKQTKTLADRFSFYFADHSLAFLPLMILRKLCGDDLLSFQLGLALLFALIAWAVTFLVAAFVADAREKAVFGFLSVAALFSSSFFAEFSLNYFKNAVAGMLLLWCAGLLARGRKMPAFVIFCLAFLTHKSVALLGVAYVGAFLADRTWRLAVRRRGARVALLQIGGAAASAILFLGVFLAFFPNSRAFLAFLGDNFTAPGPRLRWLGGLFERHPLRAVELGAYAWIIAGLWVSRKRLPPGMRSLLVPVTVVFVLALQPFQEAGAATLGYRLVLLLPILLVPLATLLASRTPWRAAAALAPLAAIGAGGFSPLGLSAFAVTREVRPFSRLRPDVERITSLVKPTDYLISHHGMEFFVDYVTGIRSRSFLPEAGFTGRVFRLAYAPPQWTKTGPARDELDQVKLLDVGSEYVLLREADWKPIAGENDFPATWRNPERRKPAHVYAE